MAKVWYCPDHPAEHTLFQATATVAQLWFVDENGHWVETDQDVLDVLETGEPNMCADCGATPVFGQPPSALEQLAQVADDA